MSTPLKVNAYMLAGADAPASRIIDSKTEAAMQHSLSYVVPTPFQNVAELENFVAQPFGWSLRSCIKRMAQDGSNNLEVASMEYVDSVGDWLLHLDYAEQFVHLRPLRVYLMPDMNGAAFSVEPDRLNSIVAATKREHLNATQRAAESLETFRKLTKIRCQS